MPLPLVPIIATLVSGGSLVPHAAGGLIVTGAGGYVAGTYLSTTAVASVLASAASVVGAGGAMVLAKAGSVLAGGAGAGIGAGVGASAASVSGAAGVLMSAGAASTSPIWVPVAATTATLLCGVSAFFVLRLRKKIASTPQGQEAKFTESEAKLIEQIVKRVGYRGASH